LQELTKRHMTLPYRAEGGHNKYVPLIKWFIYKYGITSAHAVNYQPN